MTSFVVLFLPFNFQVSKILSSRRSRLHQDVPGAWKQEISSEPVDANALDRGLEIDIRNCIKASSWTGRGFESMMIQDFVGK